MPRFSHFPLTSCLAAGLACAFAASPAALMAQSGAFTDLAAIDAQVQAFAGAPIGSDGGARGPVDRRLRLALCAAPLSLSWHGRRQDMVKVECGDGGGWRVFVPMLASTSAAVAAQPAVSAASVERGQIITIALVGRGFTVTQQGEALEDGPVGAWIRVRPEGQRESVRARVDNPGRVVIPMG